METDPDLVEVSAKFFRYGTGQLTQPFSQQEIHPYTRDAVGVVVHKDDTQLIDDQNIHIYYEQPPITRDARYEDREITLFEDIGSSGKGRPSVLYVRENGNFGEMGELTDFLERHFYTLKQEEEMDEESLTGEETDPYKQFIAHIDQHSSGSLEQYLRDMLDSMGLKERANLVIAYLNIFQVGFVDEDMNANPLSNYELLEFVGDLASWKPLNDIFIEYADEHGIELTEPVITSMHRSFASKEKQAQIAKKLQLYVFLKKKGEVTIDTHEDLFESFVGSLFLTNFHIRALLSIDLKLHEVFLRWVYSSWDLSGYVEKPEITLFYEQMRVLVGTSAFKERLINASNVAGARGGLWIMKSEKGAMDKVTERLTQYDVESPEIIKEFVARLVGLIGKPYKNDDDAYESRRAKYHEITTLISEFISSSLMQQMTNDRNTADWEEHIKVEFEEMMHTLLPDGYLISQRFTDKGKTGSYWVVVNNQNELVYSNMGYDQSENPEVLISLIRDQMEGKETTVDQSVTPIPYDVSMEHPHYFLDNDGKKWFLTGTPNAVENYISEVYEKEEGKFFLIIHTSDEDGIVELEYDPRPHVYVNEGINWEYLRDLFVSEEDPDAIYRPDLPPAIHRYIGDRAAYGYTALIAVLNHQITNPHHLTAVRNFYRSKELKKEVTRLLNIHDADDELISFDQLVGMNLPMAEQIITYLYMHVVIDPSVIHTAEKRIEALRGTLFHKQDADAKRLHKSAVAAQMDPKELKKREARAKIRTMDGSYVYETSKGEHLSVQVSGFNYARVKEVFANHILAYEQSLHPQLNTMRNARFSSMPGYDALRQVMEFRNIEEWQLGWNWKNKVRKGLMLRLYTPVGLTYITGPNIDAIVKQL